jgi:AbiV family abortive infection protein
MKPKKVQGDITAGTFKTILMNGLVGRNSKEVYLNTYNESINEAYKLLKEAKLLLESHSFERAYFLGFSALEEISKSQLAADVYTGLISEKEFKKAYKDHKTKISRIKWIQLDGNSYPYFDGDSIRIKDFDFQKKLKSMYVDVNFNEDKITTPNESVTKEDSKSIIRAVEIGLFRIYDVTIENGEQIGTKGFMK